MMAGPEESLPAAATPMASDKSLGELFAGMTADLGDLVTSHINLAKAEIKEEVTETGKAAGVLGAGVFATYMVIVLGSFTLAWALASFLPTGVAFLIVTALWAVAAVVLIVSGKTKAHAIHGPDQTMATIKEDVEWAKHPNN